MIHRNRFVIASIRLYDKNTLSCNPWYDNLHSSEFCCSFNNTFFKQNLVIALKLVEKIAQPQRRKIINVKISPFSRKTITIEPLSHGHYFLILKKLTVNQTYFAAKWQNSLNAQ